MLRSGAAGSLGRVVRKPKLPTRVLSKPLARSTAKPPLPSSLALTTYKGFSTSLQRYQTSDRIDIKHEKEVAKEHLEPHPDQVSSVSSVHQVFHEQGVKEPEKDEDMLAGIKSDWKVVKATFALDEVPREALYIGFAGVLPYMATSLSTVYLAFDINHAQDWGTGFLFSSETAELILHVIEPIQIGYGAVIISFLGAIHWGLEWAKFGGSHGYRRYAYGVVAPAVAWPTILFPVEYALISQFLAFTFLYYADARAVVKGWAPQWYSTYRFVLTFVVGTSIVLSLIGRGEIADKISKMPGPADRMKALKDSQLQSFAEEEEAKRQRLAQEEEEEDEEDEDEDEDEED
ncbi:MAG: hypothetical protein Q9191_001745 [Dirinaria sp. TL-2023a]